MKILSFILSFLLVTAGAALGAQNVANTSQKGSLLIWPLITIEGNKDTFIEISNDGGSKVLVKCYYVNERKGRVDFGFELSRKQTASWSVKTLDGDQANPSAFPDGGTFNPGGLFAPTSLERGELVCFAVNALETHQIAWNHLSGTATVVNFNDTTGSQPKQSFRYNAWSFVARGLNGVPAANGTEQGTAGRLDLTGGSTGTYDACPAYNIANFMPNGATLGTPVASSLTTLTNVLSVVSCNQDLRQNFLLNLTKLQFTVWNSKEYSFTGAHICVDSVNSVALGFPKPPLVNGKNFEFSLLKTPNARFKVSGVQSSLCTGTTSNSALLGVLASGVSIGDATGQDQENGSNTHGAGAANGFVLWDFEEDPLPFRPKR